MINDGIPSKALTGKIRGGFLFGIKPDRTFFQKISSFVLSFGAGHGPRKLGLSDKR